MKPKIKDLTVRHGDLVAVHGTRRKFVALSVTAKDIRRGLNVSKPGIHLFSGYWYANSTLGGPLCSGAYGKVIEPQDTFGMRVVGHVRSHYAAKCHCR